MIVLVWYVSLLFFAINGLIFLGHYNRDKCAKLIILEHHRHLRRRRRR